MSAVSPEGDPFEPPLDPRVLLRLDKELGGEHAVDRICGLFLDLLPGRLDRLRAALRAEDSDAALEVTLSIAVTSATFGGVPLHKAARDVEALILADQLADAADLVDELQRNADEFSTSLRAELRARALRRS